MFINESTLKNKKLLDKYKALLPTEIINFKEIISFKQYSHFNILSKIYKGL